MASTPWHYGFARGHAPQSGDANKEVIAKERPSPHATCTATCTSRNYRSADAILTFAKRPETLPTVMKTLLSLAKTVPSPLTLVPLLGISIDVTLRLKNIKDETLKSVDPTLKV